METRWRFLVYVLFFVFFLVLQVSFAKFALGFCDESDNFYGGLMLSSGYQLYTDFKTHHMPLLYLLYAVIYPLVPHSVVMLRVAGFALLTCLYLFIFVRYRKHVGIIPTLLYPLVYIGFLSALATVEHYCITMCSELFEAQGAIILLCEFLVYLKKREVSLSSCVAVSFAIVLMFGSVFMGILGVLVIGVAVLACEIHQWFGMAKQDKHARPSLLRWLASRNWRLLVAIAVPWIVACIILLVQGILDEAFYSSYVFNQEVYGRYQDAHGNPLMLFLVGVKTMLTPPTGALNITRVLKVGYIWFYAGILCFVITRLVQRRFCEAVVPALFAACFCARGVFFPVAAVLALPENTLFHATPAWAVSAFLGLLAVQELKGRLEPARYVVAACMMACSFWLYSASYQGVVLQADDIEGSYADGCTEDVIARYLDEDDKVFNAVLGYDAYLLRDDVPSINGCYLPWFADVYQDEALEQLKAERPKVAFYFPDQVIWGYRFQDYAADIARYLEENYRSVDEPNAPNVYVRKDLVD